MLLYFDADVNVQAPQTFRESRRSRSVLWATARPIYRKACVFMHVINIHAEHIAFLWRPLLQCDDTIGYHCVRIWNLIWQNLPSFPPPGWPLQMSMCFFASLAMMFVLGHGMMRIWMVFIQKNKRRLQSMKYALGNASFRSCLPQLWMSSTPNM